MRLYGGSYERFLFGFELSRGDGALSLEQVLSIPAHKSAVKCMDTAGNVVVTGGADDQLHLFNMRSNTDLGFLVNPAEGAVPCVTFVTTPESQHPTVLLSGSVGGDICVWRAEGFWEHVKGMKGHRDLVSSMSPHPSGKLALSVSRDKQMRLWDLTKGQCAYQAALGDDGDLVGFFQGGDMYYVSSSDPSTAKGSKVSLHSIQGDTVATIEPNRKVLAVKTHGENTLVAGCEGGHLMCWDIRKPSECIFSLDKAHKSRIRGLTAPFELSTDLLGDDGVLHGQGRTCIASASSDGVIKTWSMATLMGGSETPAALAEIDAQARFTCLCVFDEQSKKLKKPKEKQTAKNVEKGSTVGSVDVGVQEEGSTGDQADGQQVIPKTTKNKKDRNGSAAKRVEFALGEKHGVVDGDIELAPGSQDDQQIAGSSEPRTDHKKKGGLKKKKSAQAAGVVSLASGSEKGTGAVNKKRKRGGVKKAPQS